MFRFIPITFALCLSTLAAQASLIDRGGGLIYDDVLNITWLQNANYAQTSGFDPVGRMNWTTAVAWADGLSYFDAVRGVTYEDWRLPATLQPDATCQAQLNDGGFLPLQGFGTHCTGSEMGHLQYVDGVTFTSPGLFAHLQGGDSSDHYWSGTEYAPDTHGQAWLFNFYNSVQGVGGKSGTSFTWAVRDGDVGAVPIPSAVWLLGSALAVMGVMRGKANSRRYAVAERVA